MSNYFSNGTDFDAILEPRQGGDPAMSDVNYQDGGVDLSDIYAPASVGTPAPNLGFLLNGSDIGPLFALLGSRPSINIYNGTFSGSGGDATMGPEPQVAINWTSDGGVTGGTAGITSTTVNTVYTGEWHEDFPSAVGADYEIFLTATGNTGNLSGSALNTWLSLGSNRSLTLESPDGGQTKSVVISWQIRPVGGSAQGPGTFNVSVQNTG